MSPPSKRVLKGVGAVHAGGLGCVILPPGSERPQEPVCFGPALLSPGPPLRPSAWNWWPGTAPSGPCPFFKNTHPSSIPGAAGKDQSLDGGARSQERHGLARPSLGIVSFPFPACSLSWGQGTPPWVLHILPFLTLASKKLLAPLTPSVETSISERRASTWSPLSSCSSPAAALRNIRRNCSGETSRG